MLLLLFNISPSWGLVHAQDRIKNINAEIHVDRAAEKIVQRNRIMTGQGTVNSDQDHVIKTDFKIGMTGKIGARIQVDFQMTLTIIGLREADLMEDATMSLQGIRVPWKGQDFKKLTKVRLAKNSSFGAMPLPMK